MANGDAIVPGASLYGVCLHIPFQNFLESP